ncbi:DUF7310 family coiled-coil domain-containing protein [Natrinema versiforme]|uniref:DUF7310 domain-containing protein n=1 Tax=Natrinema versiforme JCM 10478 TaxID=1227496 RepID=L9Y1Z1_9EURY|nr:hypothetical protein [Natrinema versiforme]ELY67742.1 hypothetical protein C489_09286 [Natrinema versiforme JCM 10478]
MSDIERIERRLSAVERAVVDGDIELDELADIASVAGILEELTAQVEEHERRLAALEGRTDALDGAVGSVDSVNEAVERRADAAVAAVDRLEYRLDELEGAVDETIDLDVDVPRPAADGITSENLTENTETDGAVPARDDRDSSAVSSKRVDASESGSDLPAVERTVSEIVSPATEGDSESGRERADSSHGDSNSSIGANNSSHEGNESDGDPPDGHTGGLSNRNGSTAREPRTTTGATQAALDDRLSDSADPNGAAGSDGVDGTSRTDDARDVPPDGDEESAGGVLQSIRARLP